MLHILIHTFIQILPFLKPFCSLIYILCFTDLARKKIVSVLVHLFEMQN